VAEATAYHPRVSEQGARDLELVRRAIAGNDGSLREMIEQIDQAARWCLAEIGARAPAVRGRAPDLLQRFHLSLLENDHRALKSFEGRASLQTWIRVVATRFFLREAKGGPKESPEGDALLEVSDASDSPERVAERRSTMDSVRKALADLEDRDRLLLQLLYEQDVAAPEAGKILGLTASGVRMRKQRLLRKLAKRLRELAP
jgi:RNA polymerase sigma factor (sigma-70 family)